MSFSNGQGSCRHSSLESAFLGRIAILDVAVVQYTPFVTLRDDRVFSQSHEILPVKSMDLVEISLQSQSQEVDDKDRQPIGATLSPFASRAAFLIDVP